MAKRNFKAAALAFVMIFSVLFSSLFVIAQSEHECTNVDCQICQTIQCCLNHFKDAGNDGGKIFIFAAFAFFVAFVILLNDFGGANDTLITLKVKLSN